MRLVPCNHCSWAKNPDCKACGGTGSIDLSFVEQRGVVERNRLAAAREIDAMKAKARGETLEGEPRKIEIDGMFVVSGVNIDG